TLGSVIPKYLKDREGDLRAKTLPEPKRYPERYWQPLNEIPIDGIERKHVVAVVDTIADEHGRVVADRAEAVLSTFFSWAIDRSYCGANPVSNIKRRTQKSARDRVLSEPEIVAIWKACFEDDYGWIVRLLILTGQRRTEISDLGWHEVD